MELAAASASGEERDHLILFRRTDALSIHTCKKTSISGMFSQSIYKGGLTFPGFFVASTHGLSIAVLGKIGCTGNNDILITTRRITPFWYL
jgi:hypothetical protein